MSTTVAFQGAAGAFSEEAARAFFSDPIECVPCTTFADVAAAVRHGTVEHGILPLENSIAGPVHASLDALATLEFTTTGFIAHPIRMNLLGTRDAELECVREVLSHPVALAQCGMFLRAATAARPVEFFDTAGAARAVALGGDPSRAAIASHAAAERYGLRLLVPDVHDRADNHTRFVILRARQ